MKNNKGFTVVELIVTFVLVMSLAVGLFAVVDGYRGRQQKETILKELNSYRNEVLKVVQDDFLNRGIMDIEGVDAASCNGDFNQAIKIIYKDEPDPTNAMMFCVGDAGIKYGDVLYPKPLGEFVNFTNDIIYTESKDFKVVAPDGITKVTKKILSINVKMKHSELEEAIELRVVGVNTTKNP